MSDVIDATGNICHPEAEARQKVSQPAAIQLLANSGCEWKTIIQIIRLARDAQRLGSWGALDMDDNTRQSYDTFLAEADIDPMQIEFR